jgi:tellurite resistance protein TerC
MSTPMHAWIVFNAGVFALLGLDLFLFQRRPHAISLRVAVATSAFWIVLALAMNATLYFFPAFYGIPFAERGRRALEFLTGYVVEESLSMDNLFVFLMLFGYFQVPPEYRHKTLFWGIFGAMVMRAVFILGGVALLARFSWMMEVFGVVLLVSAARMAMSHGEEADLEGNWVLRGVKRLMPITAQYEGDRFFVRRQGRLWATPLFVTLAVVEASDVMFAVDSIPAVLAVTRHPFIAYASNICAILGLRALFFALAGLMESFRYLSQGLVTILGFIGLKMLLARWIEVPLGLSLGFIAVALAVAVGLSWALPQDANSSRQDGKDAKG